MPRPVRFTPGKDPVWMGAENLTHTGIRFPDRPARSESLYQLSYPGQTHFFIPALLHFCILIKNDKAVPLQAWSGPEGSRKLRFPDFMTTVQDGGKVVSITHRPPLPPRKYTWYSFLLEAESTPGP